jgi:hypothetical protein
LAPIAGPAAPTVEVVRRHRRALLDRAQIRAHVGLAHRLPLHQLPDEIVEHVAVLDEESPRPRSWASSIRARTSLSISAAIFSE